MNQPDYLILMRRIECLELRCEELKNIIEMQAKTLEREGLPCQLQPKPKTLNDSTAVIENPHVVIDKLWECSSHGTRREDVIKAYRAGIESCKCVVQACRNEASVVAHPDAEGWTEICLNRINAIDDIVKSSPNEPRFT